jgi:hypothetical protein
MVDLDLIKRSIFTFVEMGFNNPDIKPQGSDFIWTGDKSNDAIYVQKFQLQLIARAKEEYSQKS